MSTLSRLSFQIIGSDDSALFQLNTTNNLPLEDDGFGDFVVHSSIDIIEEIQANTSKMFLKCVDQFQNKFVYAYVTANHTKFILLYSTTDSIKPNSRTEENIKNFFMETHEAYVKALLNPLNIPNSRLENHSFVAKIQNLVRKHIL
eukprot:TRINITY_DN3281_c2_g6_i1.p1 TRINITY_DN3281_c2_g6~~TRINITY_DN3281_c2_g6_i1.p1  ORF type:complete len:156 (+),score=34.07 TRINITY_DN3281_c2_g6_i1:32-469(+)